MSIDAISSSSSAAMAALPLVGGGDPAAQAQRLSAQTPEEQRKAVASQFEAILVRQFLQESVGSMLGTGAAGGASSATGGGVYGYLLTDVLAQQLSGGGGLGLSSLIERQLTPASARVLQAGSTSLSTLRSLTTADDLAAE